VLQGLRPVLLDIMSDTVIGDQYGNGVLDTMVGEHIQGVDGGKRRRLEAVLAVSFPTSKPITHGDMY
jgi:hypothetical protein